MENLKQAALVLRALNHQTRWQMVMLLRENGSMNVTEIRIKLKIDDQAVVSNHLAALRTAGIVTSDREGKYMYYRVDSCRLEQIKKSSIELSGYGTTANMVV